MTERLLSKAHPVRVLQACESESHMKFEGRDSILGEMVEASSALPVDWLAMLAM